MTYNVIGELKLCHKERMETNMKFKKGDIVVRKSYDKDIAFVINNIIGTKDEKIAILKGLILRIEADSPLYDLELLEETEISKLLNKFNKELERKKKYIYDKKNTILKRSGDYYGRILHLDGDKKYSEKSQRFYRNIGLDVIVKNVAEYKQPKIITSLLCKYNPDIIVITRT